MNFYDDIIHLPHHVSKKRQPMSLLDRAAQFSPFAALTGYEAAIAETGRLTDSAIELDVDGQAMLDAQIRRLLGALPDRPRIKVTYFIPDERKSGGAYVTVSGTVRKIDRYGQQIHLEDGTILDFDRIYEILRERESFDREEKG